MVVRKSAVKMPGIVENVPQAAIYSKDRTVVPPASKNQVIVVILSTSLLVMPVLLCVFKYAALLYVYKATGRSHYQFRTELLFLYQLGILQYNIDWGI